MTWEAGGVQERRAIGAGLALLIAAGPDSTPDAPRRLAEKIAQLRIFPDAEGRTNRSLIDVDGEVLAVSQFTLYADLSRGRRPSFLGAGDPDAARVQYETFISELRGLNVPVESGSFGAQMLVTIENDGPFTLALSTDDWAPNIAPARPPHTGPS